MDFDSLSRDISELRQMRDQLVTALTDSIGRLRTLGTCPSSEVLDNAGRYRHRYVETRRQMSLRRGAVMAGPLDSLEEWEQAIRQARREQQVTELLDAADAWQVRGIEGLGPLTKVRHDVEQLRRRLHDGSDPALDDVLAGRHPLAAVRTLVQQGDELSDGEWADLLDRVSQGYGRELATAISRGKVLVRAELPLSQAVEPIANDQKLEVLS